MIDKLIHGHQNFQKRFFAGERSFLRGLVSHTQNPSALYVGCSDSRIVPELLMSAKPGDLFVVRNVANLVPTFAHADSSVGAALEYAIGYLNTPHVIVCGHYGCGGVKAAVEGLDAVKQYASLHEWLEGVLPAVEALKSTDLDPDARWRKTVEENVIEQLSNLTTYPTVATALQEGRLEMHGWTFDPFSTQLFVYDVETDKFVRSDELL